jgi:hypothetical protein
MTQALTRQWYTELEAQAATNFINLPMEFQLKGYDYEFISKSYLNFFQSENTRNDKLQLARKFLKFLRTINKNRAKAELGTSFFKTFSYFMENFPDLLSKQDNIHLETLTVITEAIDKSQFIEDVISVDDLKRRITSLNKVKEHEETIHLSWDKFEEEYNNCQMPEMQQVTQTENLLDWKNRPSIL